MTYLRSTGAKHGVPGHIRNRAALALALLVSASMPNSSQAGLFSDLTGGRFHQICRAMDGTSDGCACAEKYILDTVSTAFLPIIEASLLRNHDERHRLASELGIMDDLAFRAQLMTIGTAGAYQCQGARRFLLEAAATMGI